LARFSRAPLSLSLDPSLEKHPKTSHSPIVCCVSIAKRKAETYDPMPMKQVPSNVQAK